ncbi:AurF N-oxygenase family protein [Pseudonocardia spinosispora]|uniref:AurF N-oxygenase family protein n=1 Tax=Pseudonocardia spinosispora TaxID=103441 RepID=UPI0003FC7856|nr:diiron oxygenase [Pseudonocardia spinosispora]
MSTETLRTATKNATKSKTPDREATAQRLLRSSLEHSYEPSLDIDWDAPLADGAYGMPAHRVSIYGTELWDQLTEEQKVTLSIHEVCSIARVGLWFEIILMQMLLRYSYDRDPRSQHIQYALTEIADECRHSIMFAKMTERYGVPDYRPSWLTQQAGRLFKTVAYGPAMFAGTLVAEEITDQLQREGMKDENVQPLTRMVSKIHVTEEARHVRYAREELSRIMPKANFAQRVIARWLTALSAHQIATNLIHPDVYRSVGLDPKEARKVARANPHHQETFRWTARKLVPFLREQGVLGGMSEVLFRKAFLV